MSEPHNSEFNSGICIYRTLYVQCTRSALCVGTDMRVKSKQKKYACDITVRAHQNALLLV